MKVAVLSDIHANQTALERVLQIIQGDEIQDFWFLGDAVDRGPYSRPILEWLKSLEETKNIRWVIGNHDALLAEIMTPDELETVNKVHIEDDQYHRNEVQEYSELWDFVKTSFTRNAWKPLNFIQDSALYVLVHSSLTDGPGFYTYVSGWKLEITLPREFDSLEKLCQNTGMPGVMFSGHTHVPMLCSAQRNELGVWNIMNIPVLPGNTYFLDPAFHWIINPGSVGQPRDLDNRTAFAVLDTCTHNITFHRADYDWRSVARQLILLNRNSMYPEILRDAKCDPETPDRWLEHYRNTKEVSDVL